MEKILLGALLALIGLLVAGHFMKPRTVEGPCQKAGRALDEAIQNARAISDRSLERADETVTGAKEGLKKSLEKAKAYFETRPTPPAGGTSMEPVWPDQETPDVRTLPSGYELFDGLSPKQRAYYW